MYYTSRCLHHTVSTWAVDMIHILYTERASIKMDMTCTFKYKDTLGTEEIVLIGEVSRCSWFAVYKMCELYMYMCIEVSLFQGALNMRFHCKCAVHSLTCVSGLAQASHPTYTACSNCDTSSWPHSPDRECSDNTQPSSNWKLHMYMYINHEAPLH